MTKQYIKQLLRFFHSILSQVLLLKSFRKEYKSFKNIVKTKEDEIEISISSTDKKFIDKTWIKFHEEIKAEVVKKPKFFFFNKASMIKTMTSDYLSADYISFLKSAENIFSKSVIKKLIKENNIGGPRILLNSLFHKDYRKTSITRSVHVYQLSKLYDSLLNIDQKDVTITEWGGGYGGLANTLWKLKKLKEENHDITYIIIDIPVSIWIQNLYLKSILDQNDVNVVQNSGTIVKGKINLVRLSILEELEFGTDIFFSAWAISESNEFSQKYVIDRNFFNATQIILFHQLASKTHPYAEDLSNYIKKQYNLVAHEETPVFSNQYYIRVENKI